MSTPPQVVIPGTVTDEQTSSIQRVALASAIGCIIEWYDFFLYGVVAGLVFNKLFFQGKDTPLLEEAEVVNLEEQLLAELTRMYTRIQANIPTQDPLTLNIELPIPAVAKKYRLPN